MAHRAFHGSTLWPRTAVDTFVRQVVFINHVVQKLVLVVKVHDRIRDPNGILVSTGKPDFTILRSHSSTPPISKSLRFQLLAPQKISDLLGNPELLPLALRRLLL